MKGKSKIIIKRAGARAAPAVFFVLILVFSGCVVAPVLIGVGGALGYVLSNDSAMGKIEASYSEVWDSCMGVLETEGANIVESDEASGIIKAQNGKVRILVKINPINNDLQDLKISARNYFIPKPYVAQDIFFKAVKGL